MFPTRDLPKFSNPYDENAIMALVAVTMPPRRRRWWHFGAPWFTNADRTRFEFALRTFLLRARDR